ncbi:PepSY domain-containing protein [Idiomarina sp. HP20-50]|uniref:PepSY domain-containing protein n=1 Tax=Idiomarina sp. HP20-50 TaxID=3070813 RepID=UPI00294AFA96|nr:PepSY domain-containing protein [Idiomarina sp. HP20-50]MDV6315151.1 PepSY domain-containing protein [Idiomarina sp. HP20-50]
MKRQLLKLSAVAASALVLSACGSPESGTTQCTMEPQENWLDQGQFQQSLKDQGYKISEFKVTEGNCYEIYGVNQSQQKVEIYFNPVDGSVVKKEVE